jgi:hypothetical protein
MPSTWLPNTSRGDLRRADDQRTIIAWARAHARKLLCRGILSKAIPGLIASTALEAGFTSSVSRVAVIRAVEDELGMLERQRRAEAREMRRARRALEARRLATESAARSIVNPRVLELAILGFSSAQIVEMLRSGKDSIPRAFRSTSALRQLVREAHAALGIPARNHRDFPEWQRAMRRKHRLLGGTHMPRPSHARSSPLRPRR